MKLKAGKSGSGGGEDVDVLVKERDSALDDLQNVENSFADLHRRYEKLRGTTEDFKKVDFHIFHDIRLWSYLTIFMLNTLALILEETFCW